ncbi:MAG TPA: hypothetical protein VN685_01405, partial [Rhizomicrobium sp.]|nr:hypothetical protein [Rhizomicrobium sp.]
MCEGHFPGGICPSPESEFHPSHGDKKTTGNAGAVTNSGPAENINLQPGTKVLGGRFTLERLVATEQPDYGAPAIWHAVGVAASFIVKAWTKRGADDIAIRTIWNHEVRNLLRLDGLSRAHDYFATLEALGADDNGYFVVVDGGGRQFLAAALADRNSHNWLRRVDQLPIRAKLWSGLAKIAVGLGMLHDQGVLHRALRAECIFTDLRGECDFRLSGFEWSLRLGAAAMGSSFGTELSRIRAPELEATTPSYSVASDWFDFGLLAAEVVGGFRPAGNGLAALNELRRSVLAATHLTETERTLIAGLLTPNPDARRIECVEVPRRVTALATRLAADQRSFDRPLVIAVHLTSGSELAQAIFHLSHGGIRIDDGAAQLAFISADISEGATVSVRSGSSQHYALHGRKITYRLYKFEGSGAPTWRAAFCAGIDRGSPDPDRMESLQGRKIRVEPLAQAALSLRDPNVRIAAWDQVAAFNPAVGNEPGGDAYDFLRFSNTVDALLTASR